MMIHPRNQYYYPALRMLRDGEFISVRQAVLDLCEDAIWPDRERCEEGVLEALEDFKKEQE